MTTVFILMTLMNGNWASTPYETSAACNNAMVGVHPVLVTDVYCVSIEMLVYMAPEIAPLPPHKPV